MTAIVNPATGEVVSYADASDSVIRARDHVNGFWAEVKWQADNQIWSILGYDDFNALWETEYEGLGVSISRAERPELVASMRAIGQTQQQIADKLGVNPATVSRDLANASSEAPPITNSRGQQRPASYAPRTPPPPEPEPDDEPEIVDAEIVPPPPARPSPEARRKAEAEQAAQTSRETTTRNVASSVWLLTGSAAHVDPVAHVLTSWQPHIDCYPQPTTAERLRTAGEFLLALAEEWPS